MARPWFRREYVKCGKAGCKKCPHGPYWYQFWREGAKVKKKYIGKELPTGADPEQPKAGPDPLDQIFERRGATVELACQILGCSKTASLELMQKQYRKLTMLHHPDRGGDVHLMKRLTAAWAIIKEWWGIR